MAQKHDTYILFTLYFPSICKFTQPYAFLYSNMYYTYLLCAAHGQPLHIQKQIFLYTFYA